jgi:hypothetical protein
MIPAMIIATSTVAIVAITACPPGSPRGERLIPRDRRKQEQRGQEGVAAEDALTASW